MSRRAITDVIARYGLALDDRDFEAAGACFTEDAQATFSGVVLAAGRAAIVAHVSGLASLAASTHLFGLPVIEVAPDGDSAHVETTAVAFLAAADGGPVRTRGLRYKDEFVRLGDVWLIRERVHRVDWMTEGEATPL
jgi:uncharacterized protein (TIGR02246 family)